MFSCPHCGALTWYDGVPFHPTIEYGDGVISIIYIPSKCVSQWQIYITWWRWRNRIEDFRSDILYSTRCYTSMGSIHVMKSLHRIKKKVTSHSIKKPEWAYFVCLSLARLRSVCISICIRYAHTDCIHEIGTKWTKAIEFKVRDVSHVFRVQN